MSNDIKHKKIRNTGLLFELLTRQITVDVLNDTKSPMAVKLFKKFFKEDTELGKEYQLYRVLMEENYSSEAKANYLINEVLKARKKLNESILRREKYNLLREIKKQFVLEDFFRARIPNFRVLASIYKIFKMESAKREFNPKEVTQGRYSVIEHITRKKVVPKSIDNKLVEHYQKQEKDLRLLSYQILVDKFNKKYKTLNSMQKNLLKEYISNISNTNKLNEFIKNEVANVTKILKRFIPKVDDKVTKIKLTEAIKQTGSLTAGRIVKDKQVVALMRYYELIKELRNVCRS
jgi:hypothetical protein